MEKKLKFKLNKKIGIFIILAIILIVSIVGVLFYNKFEFNIVGNEREEAKAAGYAVIPKQAIGIGGSGHDYITSIIESNDGGFIVGGAFSSKTIDLGGNVGNIVNNNTNDILNALLIKYDSNKNAKWAVTIDGDKHDHIMEIASTGDGGCVALVNIESNSCKIGTYNYTKSSNDSNYIIVKYNSQGTFEWIRKIGNKDCSLRRIISGQDGGFFVSGDYSSSFWFGEKYVSNNGKSDGILCKFDSYGTEIWARTVGGTENDYISSVIEMKNKDIIIVVNAQSDSIKQSFGGHIEDTISNSSKNQIVCCYTREGYDFKWSKEISSDNYINNMIASKVEGFTSINKNSIIKYDDNGTQIWKKKIIDADDEFSFKTLLETADGGYIIGGEFYYSSAVNLGDGVILNGYGEKNHYEGMLVKVSSNSIIQYAKSLGSITQSTVNSIISITNSSKEEIIVAGFCFGDLNLGNNIILNNNRKRRWFCYTV